MKPIRLSHHASEQGLERGASASEVVAAIRQGAREPAKYGHFLCRLNLRFDRDWQGRHYALKQVAAVVSEAEDEIVVVTVFTYYF